MRRSSKSLVFLFLAVSAALSWAETDANSTDAAPSPQSRLVTSIRNQSENQGSGHAGTNPQAKPNTGASLGPLDLAQQIFDSSSAAYYSLFPPGPLHDQAGAGQDGQVAGNGGNGSGNNSGGSGSGRGGQIVSNDNASVNPGAGKDNGGNGNGNQNPMAQPETQSTVKGSAQALQKWWPMCLFIDETVSDPNTIIKEMVDEAAQKCSVQIIPYPVKVDWGSVAGDADFKKINDLTRSKCNFPNGLQGSATALVKKGWKTTAAQMCRAELGKREDGSTIWNESVAGCAEVSSKSGLSQKQLDQGVTGSGSEHLHKVEGGVAVSIEVELGHDSGTVAHEAIGHSEMGKPNGSKYGHGIGEYHDPNDPNDPPEKEDEKGALGWQPKGCDIMRQNAHDNGGAENEKAFGSSEKVYYDPSRQTYSKPNGPMFDLKAGYNLFDPRKPLPKPGPVLIPQQQFAQGGSRPITTTKGETSSFEGLDPFKKVTDSNPPQDTKHRQAATNPPDARVAGKSLTQPPSQQTEDVLVTDTSVPVSVPVTTASASLAPRGGRTVSDDSIQSYAPGAGGSGSAATAGYSASSGGSGSVSVAGFAPSGGASSSGGRTTYDDGAGYAPGAGSLSSGAGSGSGSGSGATSSNSVSLGGSATGTSGSGTNGASALSKDGSVFASVGDDGEDAQAIDPKTGKRKPGKRTPRELATRDSGGRRNKGQSGSGSIYQSTDGGSQVDTY